MRSSCIAAVVAAGVGVLGMGAPASAMTNGAGLAASEGAKVTLVPGHEQPLAHVLGAALRSQPRPVRAGQPANRAKPKVDPRQPVVPGLDLSIDKSHIGPFKQGQHNATYMITVSNLGSVDAFGVFSVTDFLPGSMNATSISGVGWDCTLATLTCDRGVEPLPSATQFPTIYLTVNVADDAPELVTNTATLNANLGEAGQVVTTATDPTRILSGDEDRGSGKGGVNVKIDNHNDSTALNLNHTAAVAAAHQAQGTSVKNKVGQAQGTSVKNKVGQAQGTSVKNKVNTKLHVHDTVVVGGKSRHHHRAC